MLYKPGVSFKQYQILHTKFIIQKYQYHSLKKMVGTARNTHKSCKKSNAIFESDIQESTSFLREDETGKSSDWCGC